MEGVFTAEPIIENIADRAQVIILEKALLYKSGELTERAYKQAVGLQKGFVGMVRGFYKREGNIDNFARKDQWM